MIFQTRLMRSISMATTYLLFQNSTICYYRPQRSCGQGNVFTAVCDSVHRGDLQEGEHPPGQGARPRPGRTPLARENPPSWENPPGPGRRPRPERTPLARETPLAGRTTPPGPGRPPAARENPPPAIRSMSDRLASYWNAFLLCEMFDLSNNNISQIHDDAFLSLRNLKKLYLGKNLLGTLTAREFNGLQSLEVLDLSDNPRVSIAPCAFAYFPQPFRLGINSIKMCDYHWCWMKQRIINGTIILLYEYEEITCSEGSWQDINCTAEGMVWLISLITTKGCIPVGCVPPTLYGTGGGGEVSVQGVSVRVGFCVGRSLFRGLCRGALFLGGVCPAVSVHGVSVQVVSVQGGLCL